MVGKSFKSKINGRIYDVTKLIEKDGRKAYQIARDGKTVCNMDKDRFETECLPHLGEVRT
jgi:hypothetical protein